jgi:hypothetical protein
MLSKSNSEVNKEFTVIASNMALLLYNRSVYIALPFIIFASRRKYSKTEIYIAVMKNNKSLLYLGII